jgi:hypothetical protein
MHDPLWTCRDGRNIKVGQMTDQHLYNCIEKIMRSKMRWRGYWMPRLLLEVRVRAMGGRTLK